MSEEDDKPVSWLAAAREVMHQATIAEAERRFGTAEPVFNYRWEHVVAVHTLAMKLAELTGADQEIVEAAAWLHDVAKDTGDDHPREGAAFARDFLAETDFPPEKIERVAEAIEAHMGLWRDEPLDNLESQVLWDADKLTKLGLTAAIHWIGLRMAKGKPLTTRSLIAMREDADWQEKTAESIHSEPARRAAAARLAAFNELWERLEAELDGTDLTDDADLTDDVDLTDE